MGGRSTRLTRAARRVRRRFGFTVRDCFDSRRGYAITTFLGIGHPVHAGMSFRPAGLDSGSFKTVYRRPFRVVYAQTSPSIAPLAQTLENSERRRGEV